MALGREQAASLSGTALPSTQGVAVPTPERMTDGLINAAQNKNNDMFNMLLEARDNLVRLTGVNGVDLPSEGPPEAESEGFTLRMGHQLSQWENNLAILRQLLSQLTNL